MRRECVSCGHEDVIALEVTEQPELVTRVNYTDSVFAEDVEPVRILDAPGSKDSRLPLPRPVGETPKEMDRMTAKRRKAAINWSSESVPINHRLPTHPHVVARHIAMHISNVLVSPINTPSSQ